MAYQPIRRPRPARSVGTTPQATPPSASKPSSPTEEITRVVNEQNQTRKPGSSAPTTGGKSIDEMSQGELRQHSAGLKWGKPPSQSIDEISDEPGVIRGILQGEVQVPNLTPEQMTELQARAPLAARALQERRDHDYQAMRDQAFGAGGEGSQLIDPLSLQVFFQQSIAPFLNRQADSMRGTATQYQSTMNQLLGNLSLPAAYKNVLQTSVPQNAANMNSLASALSGGAVAAPSLDALLGQLRSVRDAELKRYYGEQAGGGGGDMGAQLVALLGGG